jgi:hypothetical protein
MNIGFYDASRNNELQFDRNYSSSPRPDMAQSKVDGNTICHSGIARHKFFKTSPRQLARIRAQLNGPRPE